jgi:hypothetical protein
MKLSIFKTYTIPGSLYAAVSRGVTVGREFALVRWMSSGAGCSAYRWFRSANSRKQERSKHMCRVFAVLLCVRHAVLGDTSTTYIPLVHWPIA